MTTSGDIGRLDSSSFFASLDVTPILVVVIAVAVNVSLVLVIVLVVAVE